MMHGKIIWKHGIDAIASRGIAPETHKVREGLQRPIWTPSCNGSIAYKFLHIGFAY